jgi:hypothetical protein
MNWIAIFVAALVPTAVGFVWYSDKGLGNAWMRENNFIKEELEKTNMLPIIALSLLFSFFISLMMQFFVIHQMGAFGMIGGDQATALPSYVAFIKDYGMAFRTFKHGALHGTMAGILFAFPLVAINAMFERKSWKYIFIHAGYWTLTLGIIGAILCGWV